LVIGLSALLRGDPIWLARAKIATTWGALIVVFYLPLHFLAFYARQADARTPRGRAFSALLALAAIGATLVIGQRTNALLPLLILAVFTFRVSLPRLAVVAALLLGLAALLLPLFKLDYADTGQTPGELAADTIYGDVSRSPVLRTGLELSEPVGTSILLYPKAGLAYR